MQATAYIHAPRQTERHVSLTKLGVVLANLALWATLICGLMLVTR